MNQQRQFNWRHFEAEIILLWVRWYLRYSLSSRDLEEMLLERGLQVDHTTISRSRALLRPLAWSGAAAPTSKPPLIQGRVAETSVKVKGAWL